MLAPSCFALRPGIGRGLPLDLRTPEAGRHAVCLLWLHPHSNFALPCDIPVIERDFLLTTRGRWVYSSDVTEANVAGDREGEPKAPTA